MLGRKCQGWSGSWKGQGSKIIRDGGGGNEDPLRELLDRGSGEQGLRTQKSRFCLIPPRREASCTDSQG